MIPETSGLDLKIFIQFLAFLLCSQFEMMKPVLSVADGLIVCRVLVHLIWKRNIEYSCRIRVKVVAFSLDQLHNHVVRLLLEQDSLLSSVWSNDVLWRVVLNDILIHTYQFMLLKALEVVWFFFLFKFCLLCFKVLASLFKCSR